MSDGHDERAVQPEGIVPGPTATPTRRAPGPPDWSAYRRRYSGQPWRAADRLTPNDWAVAVVDAHA